MPMIEVPPVAPAPIMEQQVQPEPGLPGVMKLVSISLPAVMG